MRNPSTFTSWKRKKKCLVYYLTSFSNMPAVSLIEVFIFKIYNNNNEWCWNLPLWHMKAFLSEQLKLVNVLFWIAPHFCSPFVRVTLDTLCVTGTPSDQVVMFFRLLLRPSQALVKCNLSSLNFFRYSASSSSYRVTNDWFIRLHSFKESHHPFLTMPL